MVTPQTTLGGSLQNGKPPNQIFGGGHQILVNPPPPKRDSGGGHR